MTFSEIPITVNVIDGVSLISKSPVITRKYVWHSSSSSINQKTLKYWKSGNIKELVKIYGPTIKSLGVISNRIANTHGGAEAEDESIYEGGDYDDLLDADFNFDDLDADIIADSITHGSDPDLVEVTKVQPSSRLGRSSGLTLEPGYRIASTPIDISDNIRALKEHIQLETGIPTYRQHLFVQNKHPDQRGHHIVQLLYDIAFSGIPGSCNILDLPTTQFENLPCAIDWYENNTEMIVRAQDEFKLIDYISYAYSTLDIFVVDVEDFIAPVKQNLLAHIDDVFFMNVIYYSFIVRYWPMMNLTMFVNYISGLPIINKSNKELYYKFKPVPSPTNNTIPIITNITRCSIKIFDAYNNKNNVNIRELFNKFDTTKFPNVNEVLCTIMVDGNSVSVSKQNTNTKFIKQTLVGDFIIVLASDKGDIINITIDTYGSYIIDFNLVASNISDFSSVYKYMVIYVDNIITYINSLNVVQDTLELPEPKNSEILDVSFISTWKKYISSTTYSKFISKLGQYVANGTLGYKNMKDVDRYYVFKGMFNYDMDKYNSNMFAHSNNQYNYIDDMAALNIHDKFKQSKVMDITHRFTDIRIVVHGIIGNEYVYLQQFIANILHSIDAQATELKSGTNRLKVLKELDPVLYSFKNSDGVSIYSKVCQKQKQPNIYMVPKRGTIKYWNFTTQSDAYYECPNAEYPHLNFITGTHPDGHCIPCCYKLPPTTTANTGDIYKSCIDDKKFDKSIDNTTSRYIMGYGKDIMPGRLSHLPEKSLNPLIYGMRPITGTRTGNTGELGYFLYGVSQSMNNISNIGYVFTIAHCLNKYIFDFIDEVIVHIKDGSGRWIQLLSGQITKQFISAEEFAETIFNTFIMDELVVFDKWNQVFIDIVNIYFGISTILFIDEYGDDSTYVQSQDISYFDEFALHDKVILVLRKSDAYFPIYNIDPTQYFNTAAVNMKVYNKNSHIISIIVDAVRDHFDSIVRENIRDLSTIMRKMPSAYTISTLLIDVENKCYGVLIRNESDVNETYLPVELSTYTHLDIPISFEFPKRTAVPEFTELNEFLMACEFADEDTNTSWLVYNNQVIGFINQLQYLIKPISMERAKNIMPGVEFKKLYYHPFVVQTNGSDNSSLNKSSSSDTRTTVDWRDENINTLLYSEYLYEIITMEVMYVINDNKNHKIRNRIFDIIKIKSHIEMLKQLRELVTDVDYTRLSAMIYTAIMPPMYGKMTIEVTRQSARASLKSVISKSTFEFDAITIDSTLSVPNIITILKDMLSDIVVERDITNIPAFNTISACKLGAKYCTSDSKNSNNNKLIIPTDRYTDILTILAADIKNPIKSQYLFSPIFIKQTIDDLKFSANRYEKIKIIHNE